MLKDDHAALVMNTPAEHPSRKLFKALLAKTLWETIATVGPDKLLGLTPQDITSLNSALSG